MGQWKSCKVPITLIKPLSTRIMGPVLVSYVYEEKGTYWLFGLCATSLLATGIVTSVAYRHLVPLREGLGADPEERAAIPLMVNTDQRLEGNKEETLSQTEKRQQEDEKLEGDPQQAKTSLTGGNQDQDKS